MPVDFGLFFKKEKVMRYWRWIIILVPTFTVLYIALTIREIILQTGFEREFSTQSDYIITVLSLLISNIPTLFTGVVFPIIPGAFMFSILIVETHDYFKKE